MDDINELLNEAKAAAARRAAIARETALQAEREQPSPDDDTSTRPEDATTEPGEGQLTVERRQGQWRCYLGGDRIRSGEALEVYLNQQVGWVRGKLLWGRRPTTPPSIRVEATDPHRIDADGQPRPMGEFELSLPEDAVCRWPRDP